MSFDFSTSMNKITDLYLERESVTGRVKQDRVSKGANRILDMLNTQISDDMQEKVNSAMSNALKSL